MNILGVGVSGPVFLNKDGLVVKTIELEQKDLENKYCSTQL